MIENEKLFNLLIWKVDLTYIGTLLDFCLYSKSLRNSRPFLMFSHFLVHLCYEEILNIDHQVSYLPECSHCSTSNYPLLSYLFLLWNIIVQESILNNGQSKIYKNSPMSEISTILTNTASIQVKYVIIKVAFSFFLATFSEIWMLIAVILLLVWKYHLSKILNQA